jgi:indoleamine 2,3-dioxygenase
MEERSDPYVYNLRVRLPQPGWTDDRIDPEGMTYEGVVATSAEHAKENQTSSWRRERYFGETGAQSSVIPAIDAALGLSCDASASAISSSADAERAQALVPYLLAMRQYMPPKHAKFIEALEPGGIALRVYVVNNKTQHAELASVFDECIAILTEFRGLHLGLAQRYVRQFDKRDDDKVIGTGGTAFMPYLRAHRQATKNHAIITEQELSK